MFGAVEIRGDLLALLEAIYRALRRVTAAALVAVAGIATTCAPRKRTFTAITTSATSSTGSGSIARWSTRARISRRRTARSRRRRSRRWIWSAGSFGCAPASA